MFRKQATVLAYGEEKKPSPKGPQYSWDALDEEALREARASRRLKGMSGGRTGSSRVSYGAKQSGNQTGRSSRSPRRK